MLQVDRYRNPEHEHYISPSKISVGSLLRLVKDFAQQSGHQPHDSFIRQKQLVILHQCPSRLEGLEFALQLVDPYDAGDKLDILRGKEVFVFSLRVFGEEADGRSGWRGERGMR